MAAPLSALHTAAGAKLVAQIIDTALAMFDNTSFRPPAPVTTVEDLLRYPTEKLVALERALPLQAAIRPVLVQALKRRGIM